MKENINIINFYKLNFQVRLKVLSNGILNTYSFSNFQETCQWMDQISSETNLKSNSI